MTKPKKITRKMVEDRQETYIVRFSGSLMVGAENEKRAAQEAASRIFSDTICIESVEKARPRR